MTKYILVIKGVGELEYKAIRDDLVKQYEAKGMEVPIFACSCNRRQIETVNISPTGEKLTNLIIV